MIHIVGSIYKEYCVRPAWNEVYGSGGRAASALAAMGSSVTLHSVASADDIRQISARAKVEKFQVKAEPIGESAGFKYMHPLSTPLISSAIGPFPELSIREDKVLSYGFLEIDPIIHAKWAVYDPQNVETASPFGANGSTAEHLALVLNQSELRILADSNSGDVHEMIQQVAKSSCAEVVVLKRGAAGFIAYEDGEFTYGHAFKTKKVWKIGSGDVFAAHFAYWWMDQGIRANDAAQKASQAAAYYCATKAVPTPGSLESFPLEPIEYEPKERKPMIYLAGPFFNLAQVWLVNEMRSLLQEAGLEVFSPLHDVGVGSAEKVVQKDIDGIHRCDLMIAITDGCDPGTLYEIGYARSLSKPVVVYAESVGPEDLKMMKGSGCEVISDFSAAIYQSVWTAWTPPE
ncbi:PfkB family carbohydrate kinase [Coraliomargarita sp. SDUM461004]|uniref:PfkB family carbohydrate kinase n=1 Tax=Thalassobacterium sedimentorum TaxID=3041258 RepID=A0ABU1AKQ0_9BACT|nr:PfkB family carbohydrate kinase [Coraliomargarita sp. SDUM461004]MDQ8195244.1 PfkB family carbohydrate kinase [Coraliomargarita sp. SDUM461004]